MSDVLGNPIDRLEVTNRVARAIWERRKFFLRKMFDIELEEWGNGEVPRSNGAVGEAEAAIIAYEAAMGIRPPEGDEIT